MKGMKAMKAAGLGARHAGQADVEEKNVGRRLPQGAQSLLRAAEGADAAETLGVVDEQAKGFLRRRIVLDDGDSYRFA